MTIEAQSQHAKTNGLRGIPRWLHAWGDRLCCVGLLAMGLGGAAWLVWYVWHMPAFR